MNSHKITDVYFYSLYDAGYQQAHSGLTASNSADEVREDIYGNYSDPRYVTIHRVPDLAGIMIDCDLYTIKRPRNMPNDQICHETCRHFKNCPQNAPDHILCCLCWEAKP